MPVTTALLAVLSPSAAPTGGLIFGDVISTGVAFGYASLHPCLYSYRPDGAHTFVRNEGVCFVRVG